MDENGFEVGDVRAIKIMRIPGEVELAYRKRAARAWPGYIYGKELFEKLGAQFRTIDGKQEMLLDDVVYAVEDYAPCSIVRERTIGRKAVTELTAEPTIGNYPYHDEDKWEGPIFTSSQLSACVWLPASKSSTT
jgi:hypothetical protein